MGFPRADRVPPPLEVILFGVTGLIKGRIYFADAAKGRSSVGREVISVRRKVIDANIG